MLPSQGSALQLFVDRLSSRSHLTEAEKSVVVSLKGTERQIAGHRDFVHVGEKVDHSSLVMAGIVGRFGQNNSGGRQLTSLYIPGDIADLPSVMNPKSAWGLVALTETTILRLPHADIRQVAARFSGVAEALWRDCVADGSIFSEWVVNVGRRDALTRLAHLFCEMAIRCERAGQGNRRSYPLPLTQADLADATGLTSVHVNRTLQELRGQSVVDLRTGTVTIQDWDRLVAVGDFDDAFMLLDGPAPRITEAA